MTKKVTLTQEDNLVRFLNEITISDDIFEVIGVEQTEELAKLSDGLFAARYELGAFFNLDDVSKGLELESDFGRMLLDAARRPLFMAPAVVSASAVGFNDAALMMPLLLPRSILFAIKWETEPNVWAQRLPTMLIALAGKRLGLSQRHANAEKLVAEVKRSIEIIKGQGISSAKLPAAIKEELRRSQERVKEIEREAAALNKAIKAKDHDAVWKIIKRNLLGEIKALKRQAKAIKPTSLKKAKEKTLLEDQAAALEKEIAEIDGEVAGYK